MATGQFIVNKALENLAIQELGGAPNAVDSQAGLDELNAMWNGWGIDEGLIYAEVALTKTLTANQASYTIGPGGDISVSPLPSRVYMASIVTAGNRTQLKIVNSETYYAHNDLAASAGTPDEMYPDFNASGATGLAKVYLWPVPTGIPVLEIQVNAPFSTWTLGGDYILPPGYLDAVVKALAWRLIPFFGIIVPQEIAANVTQVGQKAELRIREMNAANRQRPLQGMVLAPPAAEK